MKKMERLQRSSATMDRLGSSHLHDVVLDTRHAEVFHHALDLGVTDVGSVDVGEKVKSGKNWYKSQVDLPDQSLSLILRKGIVEFGLFMGKSHTSILVVLIHVDLFDIFRNRA